MTFFNCVLNDGTMPRTLHLFVSYNIKPLWSDSSIFQTWKLDHCLSLYLRPETFFVGRLVRTDMSRDLLRVVSPRCE